MTTLPQTISARPRPAQSVSAVPAVASPMVMPMPMQAAPAGGGMSGPDLWRVFRQNLWLFILAVFLSGVIGFAANEYMKRYHLRFTAEGMVEVQPPRQFDPTGSIRIDEHGNDIDLKIILQNQVQRLRSKGLLTEILREEGTAVRQSNWLRREALRGGHFDQAAALGMLEDSFNARPIEGSSMILVTMKAGDPEEARGMLEEIVNRRIEQVRQLGRQGTGSQADALRVLANQKKAEIDNIERELRNMEAELSADDASEQAVTFKIMEITRNQQETQDELMMGASALKGAQDAVARGQTLPEVEMQLAQDPLVQQVRFRVDELEIELEAARVQFGERHQTFKTLETRLLVLRDQLAAKEEDARARYTQQYISGLQGVTNSTAAKLETLEKQLLELSNTQTALAQTRARIQMKRDELTTAREQLGSREEQVAILQTTTTQRPHEELRWAVRPVRPDTPSSPKLPVTLGLSIFIGLGLAVGLAFLREMLDSSVKSPRDVARVGHMNLLGMIPDDSQDPQAGDPLELTIANAPHSMTAEQFRIMRSRLGHLAPLETTRTILVTSPQPGDGKTTVACNLAAGMALNGRRILLVDANFRKPSLHKVFELANERGLSDCLADPSAFEEVVHETKVPNLFVLPSGPRPENPAELIEGTTFTEVVDRALEDYDHVIFDSGPILFVSETGALAPQCDGVISVVRARRSTRGLLGRLRDQLRSLNVEHLGVVLNAVRHHAGCYYNRNIKTYYAYTSNGNGRR